MMLKEVKDGPHVQGASPQRKGQGPRENSLVSSPPLCLLGGLLCALPVLDSGISLETGVPSGLRHRGQEGAGGIPGRVLRRGLRPCA